MIMRIGKFAALIAAIGLLFVVLPGGDAPAFGKGKAKGHHKEHKERGHGDKDDDQDLRAPLQLPIAGTVEGGGTFSGTFSLERFAAVDGKPVAVGMVKGLVTGPTGAPVGTALAGPLELPVEIKDGAAPAGAQIVPQQAECQVLHLEIAGVNLNLLGLTITTQPIVLDLAAEAGGTNVLGSLICAILELLGNVVGLVDLLNELLGVLGGLAG